MPERRRYANPDTSETVLVELRERGTIPADTEGHLYVEITAEVLEMLLTRAGFDRTD